MIFSVASKSWLCIQKNTRLSYVCFGVWLQDHSEPALSPGFLVRVTLCLSHPLLKGQNGDDKGLMSKPQTYRMNENRLVAQLGHSM